MDQRRIVAILVVDRVAVVMGHAKNDCIVRVEYPLREGHGHYALELLGSQFDPLIELLACSTSLLSWKLPVLEPSWLIAGEEYCLQMAEQQPFGEIIERNQRHPLA